MTLRQFGKVSSGAMLATLGGVFWYLGVCEMSGFEEALSEYTKEYGFNPVTTMDSVVFGKESWATFTTQAQLNGAYDVWTARNRSYAFPTAGTLLGGAGLYQIARR